MIATKTSIEEVLILEPAVFGDHRGWFTETYSKSKFQELGLHMDFVQDNHSMSAQKGTLRGLHFQNDPKAQTKLVRCTKGRILDVAVDLRKGSPTYKKWVAVELSEENKKQLLVPKGFAHGFMTLTDDVEVQYKVDEYYAPQQDRSIRFDDPELGVDWGMVEPILSDKDKNASFLKDSDANFTWKVLVTGVKGQLGYDVVKRLAEFGIQAIGVDKDDFDLTDREQTYAFITKAAPHVIVHCAAYTAVDKAEEDLELCTAVNVTGTRNVAEAARDLGASMVYISTDYVFDGTGDTPSPEDRPTQPINHYGLTKEQGEQAARALVDRLFVVRTSWVYGLNGNNFVKTMLRLAETRNELGVVADQTGAPTYTVDLARLIVDLIQTDQYGTYHGVNEGFCSWHEFAQTIFQKVGLDIKVNPLTTEQYPTAAKRPRNSRLATDNTTKAGLEKLPHWENALDRFLLELGVVNK